MVDVKRVKLPGVGVLHSFVTGSGSKVAVVAHRSGMSDLISFENDSNDPDAEKSTVRLSEEEAHTLAELLGGTQITESISSLDQVPGLSIDWFRVEYDDYIAGRELGRPAESGFAGLVVVAVVRGEQTSPAPTPDFKVFPGDTLVVAGRPDRVTKAFSFFNKGPKEGEAATGLIDLPPGD